MPSRAAAAPRWRFVGRYLAVVAVTNLAWEMAQLPLYTLAWTGTYAEIAYAVVHCTVGDIMIAAAALLPAMWALGGHGWPERAYGRVAVAAVVLGIVYTVFSEWLNVEVRRSWEYTELMPQLPPLGTGLTPVLQWLILPPLGLAWVGRRSVVQ